MAKVFTLVTGGWDRSQCSDAWHHALGWISHRYETRDGAKVSGREMYEAYVGWCRTLEQEPISRLLLGKVVVRAFPHVVKRKLGSIRNQVPYYVGIGPVDGLAMHAKDVKLAERCPSADRNLSVIRPIDMSHRRPMGRKRQRLSSSVKAEKTSASKKQRHAIADVPQRVRLTEPFCHAWSPSDDARHRCASPEDGNHSYTYSDGGDHASTHSNSGDHAYTHSNSGDHAYTHSNSGDHAYTHSNSGDHAYTHSNSGDHAYTHSNSGDHAYTHSSSGDSAYTHSSSGEHAYTHSNSVDSAYTHSNSGDHAYTHSSSGDHAYTHFSSGDHGYTHSNSVYCASTYPGCRSSTDSDSASTDSDCAASTYSEGASTYSEGASTYSEGASTYSEGASTYYGYGGHPLGDATPPYANMWDDDDAEYMLTEHDFF